MRRWIMPAALALVVLGAGAAIGTVSSAPLLIVRNPSPSMPTGWYLRVPLEPAVGRIVVIDPPIGAQAAGWPANIPLIKPVAAAGGDYVCLRDRTSVLINSTSAASMRAGANWNGCRTLEDGELFLLAPARIDSVDGRVFGPISRADVVGVFVPLWTEIP